MTELSTTAPADSAYLPSRPGERDRLFLQANLVAPLDERALAAARELLPARPLVVLDLGCADGVVTLSRFADPAYAHVIGVDRNRESLTRARAASTDPKFSFLRADLSGDFAGAVREHLTEHGLPGVDLVFSALTLHHLADPVATLRQAATIVQRPGVLVLRSSDDGTKLAYPDPDGHLDWVLATNANSPGASDRRHGRKLVAQCAAAGLREVRILQHTQDLAGKSLAAREHLFLESLSYRRNYLAQVAEADPDDIGVRALLEEMDVRLAALREAFQRPDFYYTETQFAAVAAVR